MELQTDQSRWEGFCPAREADHRAASAALWPASEADELVRRGVEWRLRQYADAALRYRRRLRQAAAWGAFAAGALMGCNVALVATCIHASPGNFPYLPFTLAGLFYLISLPAALLLPLRSFHARNRARAALVGCDDVRAVGPLADMLSAPEPGMREAAAGALARLLPRLGPSDAGLLNSEQRANLHSVLQMGRPEEAPLKLAILRALAHVGDSLSIPFVERLARMPFRRDRPLRAAAEECLAALRSRSRSLAASKALLRAAAAGGSHELLKVAVPPSGRDSEILLRAG